MVAECLKIARNLINGADMNYIDKLVRKLRALDDHGSVVQPNGTKLIRKNPPRKDGLFADSYLHEIYAGLKENEINDLERLINKKFPAQLREFYGYANGLSVFADSLSIRGLRRNYSRDIGARLPVSLEYGNTIEKPDDWVRDQIRFGWYSAQGEELVIYLDNPTEICAVSENQGAVLYSWPSIEELLSTEVDRMSDIYLKDPDKIGFLSPIPMR